MQRDRVPVELERLCWRDKAARVREDTLIAAGDSQRGFSNLNRVAVRKTPLAVACGYWCILQSRHLTWLAPFNQCDRPASTTMGRRPPLSTADSSPAHPRPGRSQ